MAAHAGMPDLLQKRNTGQIMHKANSVGTGA